MYTFSIDVIQIAAGFSRFTRGFTYRTPDQIEEWLADLRVQIDSVDQQLLSLLNRRAKLAQALDVSLGVGAAAEAVGTAKQGFVIETTP